MGPARFHCATLLLLWKGLEIKTIIDFHILFELAQTCSSLFIMPKSATFNIFPHYIVTQWDFYIGQLFQIDKKILGKSRLVVLELVKRFGEHVYYTINIYSSMRQA